MSAGEPEGNADFIASRDTESHEKPDSPEAQKIETAPPNLAAPDEPLPINNEAEAPGNSIPEEGPPENILTNGGGSEDAAVVTANHVSQLKEVQKAPEEEVVKK